MSEEYKIEESLYYSEEHEWVKKLDDGLIAIGVTDYAQSQLHEIVYVELPDVNAEVSQMDVIGAVESVKAVSDISSPVSGKIVEINEELIDSPERINDDPYGDGWVAKIEPVNLESDLAKLMGAKEYKKHIATSEN